MTTQHHPEPSPHNDEVNKLIPFTTELERLAREANNATRRGWPLQRCLSALVAIRPLVGLLQESTLTLLGHESPEADADDVADPNSPDDDTPGYL